MIDEMDCRGILSKIIRVGYVEVEAVEFRY